jgi:hypothetical protein
LGNLLSLIQEYHLRQILEGENPKQMKLAFALWNRRAMMELIEQEFAAPDGRSISAPLRLYAATTNEASVGTKSEAGQGVA